jgi:hypothetical protein
MDWQELVDVFDLIMITQSHFCISFVIVAVVIMLLTDNDTIAT